MSEQQRTRALLCFALLCSLSALGCNEDAAPEPPDPCESIAERYRATRARSDEACNQDSDCHVYIELPLSDQEDGAMGARFSCQPRALASNVDELIALSEEARAEECVAPLGTTTMVVPLNTRSEPLFDFAPRGVGARGEVHKTRLVSGAPDRTCLVDLKDKTRVGEGV